MKKNSIIIITIFIMLLTFSLSACGDESISAKFALTGIIEGDQEYDEEALKVAIGENYSEDNFIQFENGNTFTMTLMGSTVNGTYDKKGKNITMSAQEKNFETVTGVLDGDNFILDVEGMTFTFANVK